MKKLTLNTLFLFFSFQIIAQNLNSNVISSLGEQVVADNFSISFTVGECIVSSENSLLINNSGFQQGSLTVTSVEEELEKSDVWQIIAFPNPTEDKIKFKSCDESALVTASLIEILNVEGKVIQLINKPQLNDEIDLRVYPNGIYFIKLYINNRTIRLFKVIKS